MTNRGPKKSRKTLFSLSPFTRLLPGLENCWANFKTFSRIQDSVRTPKMNLHFFKLWCICFFSVRISNVGKFPSSWFLGDGTQKEKIVVAYLFPPKHIKLDIFTSQSCSDVSKQCTYQNLLLFWCFQCGGHLRC